jgi:hypothetical protein
MVRWVEWELGLVWPQELTATYSPPQVLQRQVIRVPVLRRIQAARLQHPPKPQALLEVVHLD